MYYANTGYHRYANNEGYSDPTAAFAMMLDEEQEETVKPAQNVSFVHDEYGKGLNWDTLVQLWI